MKFVILKSTVGDRDSYQETLPAHREYLSTLLRQKTLLISGSYNDKSGGMLVIDADGFEEAITIARQDPLVARGVDRYQVKAWNPTVDLDPEATGLAPAIKPLDTGPLVAPDEDEVSFTVVDSAQLDGNDGLMVHCLIPDQIPLNDPVRLGYLRLARDRGLRKLALLYEDGLAGQLEVVPPEVSGFPVRGDGVALVHCLWVKEEYTGLSGGRTLLAAAAAGEGVKSLVTVAYNDTLPWMPASFFEAQGFTCLDQMETGRFFDNTPIVANLMWRPVVDSAPPPIWDRKTFLDGVDFCPRYPWMSGKRLYWGDDYDYHGVLVREGLRRPEILRQLPILDSRRTSTWTIIKIGVPEADLGRATDLIRATLIEEPTYFAHLYDARAPGRVLVVFPDRVFEATDDRQTWQDAVRYGIDKGIPREELNFGRFVEEREEGS